MSFTNTRRPVTPTHAPSIATRDHEDRSERHTHPLSRPLTEASARLIALNEQRRENEHAFTAPALIWVLSVSLAFLFSVFLDLMLWNPLPLLTLLLGAVLALVLHLVGRKSASGSVFGGTAGAILGAGVLMLTLVTFRHPFATIFSIAAVGLVVALIAYATAAVSRAITLSAQGEPYTNMFGHTAREQEVRRTVLDLLKEEVLSEQDAALVTSVSIDKGRVLVHWDGKGAYILNPDTREIWWEGHCH